MQAARIAGDPLRSGLPQYRIAAWLSRYYEAAADRLAAAERERIDRLTDRLSRASALPPSGRWPESRSHYRISRRRKQ